MSSRVPHVFIALPSRPGENIALDLAVALHERSTGAGAQYTCTTCGHREPGNFTLWGWKAAPCSILTFNFNQLWVLARNLRTAWFLGEAARKRGEPRESNPYAKSDWAQGWDSGWDEASGKPGPGPLTDFVMVHSDVAPTALDGAVLQWVQTLLVERRRVGAGVVSSVIALKDETGLSSTAAMRSKTGELKKLLVRDCLPPKVPTTFCAKDLADGDVLLVNTGLWCADLTAPWTRRVCFRCYDTILLGQDGIDRATCTGEDFLWSVDLYRLGVPVYATTIIPALHQGTHRWPNFVDFGTHEEEKWGTAWCIEPPAHWQYMDKAVK